MHRKCILVFMLVFSITIYMESLCSAKNTSNGEVKIVSANLKSQEGSTESVLKEVTKINNELKTNLPRVTEVYSVNNKLKNAYYKPKLKDVPNLKEKILSCGFVTAYTGFFDLDRSDPYKPNGKQTRALEILGYDMLLEEESFSNGKYNIVETPELVSKGTAIMDIYKALHQPQYALSITFSPNSKMKKTNSPAVVGLPSYVHDIDSSRGRTEVFTTRTCKKLYLEKAKKDMNISSSGLEQRISNGDFIVLLTRMMHLYGEPVMSQAEQHALLQSYGSEIPTYLTDLELQSYLYLKARGVLNIDLDYRMPLEFNDMLDILMCVYDKDSRTDFKKVQVSLDIGNDLISKGYFPRTVNLAVGESALEIEEESYDYSNINYYDYYIKVDEYTEFKSKEGNEVNYLFVPSIPGKIDSEELSTAKYDGIVTSTFDGEKYYHFIIQKLDKTSRYMKLTKSIFGKSNYIQIDTAEDTDKPSYVWLEQGGGIYSFSQNSDKGVVLSRREFNEGEFIDSMSIERVKQKRDIIAELANIFSPMVANAATLDDLNDQYKKGFGTALVTFKINSANTIISYEDSIPDLKVKKDKKKNQWTVTLPVVYKDYFKSSLKRDSNSKNTTSYPAIATIDGEGVLVKYSQLIKAGVVFNRNENQIPTPTDDQGQILVLYTKNGRIKLNNKTREIVVGNVLYKVKNNNISLFKYVGEKGKQELYIDFRAAYGWTSNVLNVCITGTGEDYTISVKTLKQKNTKHSTINSVGVCMPDTFKTSGGSERVYVLPEDGSGSTKSYPKVVMSSGYSLANWLIFQGIDRVSGLPKDYLFIYYPKEAFAKGKRPKGLSEMRDIVGYSLQADNWVCRVVELSRTYNNKPGKFTYVDGLGYLYNLPEWSDFTMSKYLKGEYLLPLSSSMSGGNASIINANVNYFTGHPYGSRPTYKSHVGVDIKGEEVKATKEMQDSIMKAAPAGVSALYGGGRREYYTASADMLRTIQSENGSDSFCYGTCSTLIKLNESGDVFASVDFTNSNPLYWSWKVKKNQKFYLVNMSVNRAKDGVAINYVYKYVMYDGNLKTEKSTIESKEENITDIIDMLSEGLTDRFSKFNEFSLSYMLAIIDSSASWIIVFTLWVIPYIGIILVTVLLGIACISDMKIIRFFCSKVFDPVKILTFGRVTVEEFTFKRSFIGLMLAYISFALILNGNLLRIIQWLLEGYSGLMELIRYM